MEQEIVGGVRLGPRISFVVNADEIRALWRKLADKLEAELREKKQVCAHKPKVDAFVREQIDGLRWCADHVQSGDYSIGLGELTDLGITFYTANPIILGDPLPVGGCGCGCDECSGCVKGRSRPS